MKKLLAILLALALCMGVALAEDVDVTGTWYLNEMASGEMVINPAAMGMEMTMTLNADGTAVVTQNGEATDGTWAMEDGNAVVTMEGDPMAFSPEEGKLVVRDSGMTMTFEKEKAEVELFVLGEAKTDAVMADYIGTWNAALAEMMGMQLSMETLGMSMKFIVEDGKVTVVEGEGEEEVPSAESEATVENGALVMKEEEQTLTLQLHEGDVLALVQDMGEGMVMSIYFERVVEEPAN